jgi:ubiquitin-like-conjugating enzyme ATG10
MLTADSFAAAAPEFADLWNNSGHRLGPWRWIACTQPFLKNIGGGYLALEGVPWRSACCQDAVAVPRVEGDEEVDAAAVAGPALQADFHIFDFHILFHPSYQQPTLYFKGRSSEGMPLDIHVMEAHFQLLYNGQEPASQCSWKFIGVEEHLVLRQPYYMLHPCQTAEVMALLRPNSGPQGGWRHERGGHAGTAVEKGVDYLRAWFSVYGPAVGLKLPRPLWPSTSVGAGL